VRNARVLLRRRLQLRNTEHVRRGVLWQRGLADHRGVQRALHGGGRQLLRSRQYYSRRRRVPRRQRLCGRHGTAEPVQRAGVLLPRGVEPAECGHKQVRGGVLWGRREPDCVDVQRPVHVRGRLLLCSGQHLCERRAVRCWELLQRRHGTPLTVRHSRVLLRVWGRVSDGVRVSSWCVRERERTDECRVLGSVQLRRWQVLSRGLDYLDWRSMCRGLLLCWRSLATRGVPEWNFLLNHVVQHVGVHGAVPSWGVWWFWWAGVCHVFGCMRLRCRCVLPCRVNNECWSGVYAGVLLQRRRVAAPRVPGWYVLFFYCL
jgi:hypothetical protein